ncbi:MAG: iron-dependent repressor [Bacteroidia bacterium]|nr:MAG: iron-dependent repressor [Bacteroidia bacterium]
MIKLSVAEENYLKAVFLHIDSEQENSLVNTNTLSQALNTTAGSVTDMLKKLSEKELIHYIPYKGVNLTEKGKKIAIFTIRKQRLWEYFLVKHLRFSWDKVHEIAEQLEHIDSEELIKKLDEYLGFPEYDPHGDPIPNAQGEFPQRKTMLLADILPYHKVVIAGVLSHNSDFLQFLDRLGLHVGTELEIIEKIPFDDCLLIHLEKNKELIISRSVTTNILVYSPE